MCRRPFVNRRCAWLGSVLWMTSSALIAAGCRSLVVVPTDSPGGAEAETSTTNESPVDISVSQFGCNAALPYAGHCSCNKSEDSCDSGTCVRQNYTCNAIHLCPKGYSCDGSECRCSNFDICGAKCASSADCPEPTECDPKTKLCHAPLACYSDQACHCGSRCMYDPERNALACVKTENKAVGQPCSSSRECESGVCYTGVCLTACVANRDCAGNLKCERIDMDDEGLPSYKSIVGRGGCVAVSQCGSSCKPDEHCRNGYLVACAKGCLTSADCEQGSCSLDYPTLGYCDEDSKPCQPSEVAVPGYSGPCANLLPCFTDKDCAEGYVCELFGEDYDVGPGSKVCVRHVAYRGRAPEVESTGVIASPVLLRQGNVNLIVSRGKGA